MDNKMIFELGPEQIKQIIHQQMGFYKTKEMKEPNCCMLGIAIVTVLDQASAFIKNSKSGETTFEGLKLYLDGDNECAINVGYSPFITKQGLIL